jgi:hypothetical protein
MQGFCQLHAVTAAAIAIAVQEPLHLLLPWQLPLLEGPASE